MAPIETEIALLLFLFGPESRSTHISHHSTGRPESDVDFLIEFAPDEKSFDNFMAASFLLEEKLGWSVELVTCEALSPHLGPHILEDVEYVEIGD